MDINQDLNVGNVWCIAKNCNKQLLACYQNDRCWLSLDCIDGCGLNDQVCTQNAHLILSERSVPETVAVHAAQTQLSGERRDAT